MKQSKWVAVTLYIGAALLYILALLIVFRSSNVGIAISMACGGSAMLCFGGLLAPSAHRDDECR